MLKTDAISYLESKKGNGNYLKEVMPYFDNVQDKLKIIHVAGSNGKGSVCAMLSSVLKEANYKVGTFISPHLIEYNERFLINGKCISDADFVRLTEKVKKVSEDTGYNLTFFEILTCIAFLYFSEQECDIVILEVGLGGRLDATNVINNSVLSIITNIGLEHTEILGDTLEKIALEKAGIIKFNGDVLVYGPDCVIPVYEKVCKERKARLYKCNFSLVDNDIELGLNGKYQHFNASIVLDAISILNDKGFCIDDNALKLGLKKAEWMARMYVLSKKPLFMIDGAHNVQCVKALTDSLDGKYAFVIGILKDKDYKEMIDLLCPYASEFVCIKPDTIRAIEPNILKEYIDEKGIKCRVFDDVYSGIEYASYKDTVVCGSLYLSGEVLMAYKKLLRKRCKEKLNNLSSDEIYTKSKVIVDKIKGSLEFKNAKNVLIYKSFDNEVDLSELEKEDKVFSYPVCLSENKMKAVIPLDGFYLNKYGILEPNGIETNDIDLVICPMLGFDSNLYRIGYGKGYYDRFLEKIDCPIIGVAYENCRVEKVPKGCFDKKLDIIYSEENIYKGYN